MLLLAEPPRDEQWCGHPAFQKEAAERSIGCDKCSLLAALSRWPQLLELWVGVVAYICLTGCCYNILNLMISSMQQLNCLQSPCAV